MVNRAGAKAVRRRQFLEVALFEEHCWDYESEWRVIDKNQEPKADIYFDRRFHLEELVAVYLGCRIRAQSRAQIVEQLSDWPSPVTLFQMYDQPLRFELKAEPIQY